MIGNAKGVTPGRPQSQQKKRSLRLTSQDRAVRFRSNPQISLRR